MKRDINSIKDTFLNYQTMYLNRGLDAYTASQFAATATKVDMNIDKNQLIAALEA